MNLDWTFGFTRHLRAVAGQFKTRVNENWAVDAAGCSETRQLVCPSSCGRRVQTCGSARPLEANLDGPPFVQYCPYESPWRLLRNDVYDAAEHTIHSATRSMRAATFGDGPACSGCLFYICFGRTQFTRDRTVTERRGDALCVIRSQLWIRASNKKLAARLCLTFFL
jgi:hypothetical protein